MKKTIKKTKPKKKLPKISTLRNKLDKLFNAYIRMRDGKCILCGSKEKLQCSHYYGKRGSPILRWAQINAYAMCSKCHYLHHHGKEPDYALWMLQKYGKAKLVYLQSLSKNVANFNRAYYNNMIVCYKAYDSK